VNDVDCDGASTDADCDDNDPSSTIVADDGDCDGTLTASDCDDTDPTSTVVADDADCDGVVTADDCDDNESTSTIVLDDADCDGVVTADDCDDTDSSSAAVADDLDCDGVPNASEDFSYVYVTSPSAYDDASYNGADGELSDGFVPPGWGVNNDAFVGWQHANPEFVITQAGGTSTEVRVWVLGASPGGISLPALISVYPGSSGGAILASIVPSAGGWVTLPLPAPTSGSVRVVVSAGGEWTMLSEVEIN